MVRHRGLSPESEPSSCSYTSASEGSTTASPHSCRSPRGPVQEPSPASSPSSSPAMLHRPSPRPPVSNSVTASKDLEDIHIELCDVDLWRTFNTNVTNEMIITKSGRKMFPIVKVKVSGMEARGMYSVSMDFVQQGSQRWKYTEGGWSPAGKAEAQPLPATYLHNKSPHYGHFWMKEPVDFAKIKVTNKKSDDKIWLNSLHLYEPRIRICKIDPAAKNGEIVVAEKSLPTCAFMAVTSYQNESITLLKIKHNPFAKGFAEARNLKEKRMMSFDEMEDISSGPTQHTPRNIYHPSGDPMQQPSTGQSPFMHFSPLSPWQNAASAYDGTFSISDASLSQQSSVLPTQSTPLSDIILPFPAAPPQYSSHQNDLDLSTSFYNSGSRPASLVHKTEKGYRHHMAPYDMTTSGLFHRRAASRANEACCSTNSAAYSSSREHNSNTMTPPAAMYNTAMSSYQQYQYQSSLYSGVFQADPGWNIGRYTGPYSPHWQRMPESMTEGQQILTALSPQDSSPASTDSGASNFLYH